MALLARSSAPKCCSLHGRHVHASLTHACLPLLCRLGPRMGPEDAGGMPASAAMLAAGSANNMPRGALGGQAAARSAGMALIGWRTRRGVALDICNLPGGCPSGCAVARLLSMCELRLRRHCCLPAQLRCPLSPAQVP